MGTAKRNPGMNVFRYMPVMLAVALLAAPVHADVAARYEAMFSDGTRVEGGKITGWGEHPGSPRLDNTSLHDARRPLRWLRNRSLKPWRMPAGGSGYIEFIGGDRIVGRVTGSRPSSEADGVHTPAHLLVVPAKSLQAGARWRRPKPLRVLIGRIRCIVMIPAPRRRRAPGTLLYHNSRRVSFVGIRPGEDSLRLLVSDGTLDVKLADVAEVHFPRIDPWGAYFRELGILSPACRSRLVRFETAGGLIATGSELRFRAVPYPTSEHLRRVLQHIKNLEANVVRLKKVLKLHTEKFDQASKEYWKQSGELENRLKAARQAYPKARADLQRRGEQQKKKEAELLTKKRQEIDREFKSADEAMVKRLTAEKPEKRDGMLKAFRLRQAQLRKTREQSLETERSRLDKQRQKELADFDTRERQKLQRLEIDCKKRTAQLKVRVDQAKALWERHLMIVNKAKLQRATASEHGSSKTWCHVIQPVWSLDALRVPFGHICMRWSFAPGQVPLSRVYPTEAVSPPLLPWHVDRNSAGQMLHSGGLQYSWGFGVHAHSELSFTLPKCAKSFQTRIGLDRIVDTGGCVRARVFAGSTGVRPLFESPLLIGSKKTVDTGRLALRFPPDGPRRLVLQADMAHRDRPRGRDPLNIRDELDWLDPVIGLDAAGLQHAVHRAAVEQMRAWKGWTVKFANRGVYTWTSRFRKAKDLGVGNFVTIVRAEKHPLVLSREITVGPRDNWVTVDTGTFAAADTFSPKAISFRIDKKEIKPQRAPVRQEWQKRDAPLLFAIGQYRRKKITLELTQPPDGTLLHWQATRVSDEPPGAYRLARALKTAGKADMKVPRGLGWAMQSDAVNDRERLTLLDIHTLGGVVNFWNPTINAVRPNELNNLLVGSGWKGGDKAFVTLAKLGGLKLLLLAEDAGISEAAAEKLEAQRLDLTVRRFERTPSALGRPCHIMIRNRCDKDVVFHWVNFEGQLVRPRTIKPNASHRLGTCAGYRYEAYIDDKLIATYNVDSAYKPAPGGRPYVAWEIKRK